MLQSEGSRIMHFGAYDYVTWAKDKRADEVYKGELDLLRKAEDLGFEHYFLPEHHFLDFCLLPNQEVFIAAAAVLTKKIQLVPFGFLINYRHPIRTAETVAMIDNISNGRMHLGISRGSVEWEYAQFGAPHGRSLNAERYFRSHLNAERYFRSHLNAERYFRSHLISRWLR